MAILDMLKLTDAPIPRPLHIYFPCEAPLEMKYPRHGFPCRLCTLLLSRTMYTGPLRHTAGTPARSLQVHFSMKFEDRRELRCSPRRREVTRIPGRCEMNHV